MKVVFGNGINESFSIITRSPPASAPNYPMQ